MLCRRVYSVSNFADFVCLFVPYITRSNSAKVHIVTENQGANMWFWYNKKVLSKVTPLCKKNSVL